MVKVAESDGVALTRATSLSTIADAEFVVVVAAFATSGKMHRRKAVIAERM
jgi:hypothetical protein